MLQSGLVETTAFVLEYCALSSVAETIEFQQVVGACVRSVVSGLLETRVMES